MASAVNLSLTVVVVALLMLFSGAAVGIDECGFLCVEGSYVACANYPGQQFPGCHCICGPRDGQDCVIRGPGVPDEPCAK